MEDSSHKERKSLFRQYFIAAFSVVVALFIISQAWPRLLAGIDEGPLDEDLLSLSALSENNEQNIQHILDVKQKVILIHSSDKTWADIGYLEFLKAENSGVSVEDRQKALNESISAHKYSLKNNPSNSYVWTRLGQGLLVRDGPTSEALGQILETSVKYAPYDVRLVDARVDISLASWNNLSDSVHSIMNTQIHIAAYQRPTNLAKAARSRYALELVANILEDKPDLLKRFLYAYSLL